MAKLHWDLVRTTGWDIEARGSDYIASTPQGPAEIYWLPHEAIEAVAWLRIVTGQEALPAARVPRAAGDGRSKTKPKATRSTSRSRQRRDQRLAQRLDRCHGLRLEQVPPNDLHAVKTYLLQGRMFLEDGRLRKGTPRELADAELNIQHQQRGRVTRKRQERQAQRQEN